MKNTIYTYLSWGGLSLDDWYSLDSADSYVLIVPAPCVKITQTKRTIQRDDQVMTEKYRTHGIKFRKSIVCPLSVLPRRPTCTSGPKRWQWSQYCICITRYPMLHISFIKSFAGIGLTKVGIVCLRQVAHNTVWHTCEKNHQDHIIGCMHELERLTR